MQERKLNRLLGFDYSQDGAYFVTLCVKNHRNVLGNIVDYQVELNSNGEIVRKQWEWLLSHYSYVMRDEYIVMPNHFHAILWINVGNGRDRSLKKTKSLSEIIGAFKTTSSKIIHASGDTGFCWQKSFWDRIIRDDEELDKIRYYIKENPVNWFMNHHENDGLDF